MFWRKKKKQNGDLASIIALEDDRYASVVSKLFEEMEPTVRAHILVAYENVIPILSATWSLSQKHGEVFTIETFIPQLENKLNATGDEINSRRLTWFLLACLLGRLEKLSRNNGNVAEVGAKIWCWIAEASPILKGALPSNIVWTQEEKEWFDLSLSNDDMIAWTINHAMPPMFAKLDLVREFAGARSLFYWPSNSRIGIVP